jgi:hypothetical protein
LTERQKYVLIVILATTDVLLNLHFGLQKVWLVP